MRCAEAIRREMVKREPKRFWISMTVGTMSAYPLLALHSAAGVALGIAVTIGALLVLPRYQRKRFIKRMGPSLAASKGELPPPLREPVLGSDYVPEIYSGPHR